MISSPLEQFSVLSISDFSLDYVYMFLGQRGCLPSIIEYNVFLFIDLIFNTLSGLKCCFILRGFYFVLSFLSPFGSLFLPLGELCQAPLGWGSGTSLASFWTDLYFHFKFYDINLNWIHWFLALPLDLPPLTGLGEGGATQITHLSMTLTEPLTPFLIDIFYELTSLRNTFLSYLFFLPVGGEIFKFTAETNSLSCLIFSLSTSSLWLSLGFVFIVFLFLTCVDKVTLISRNRWQTLVENYYEIVWTVVNDSAGSSGIKFFPLIFTVFTIILICNILGMIPYSFTVTSHLIVTFSMALAIFLGINALGILKNGRHFLSLFFPPGAPLALAPLLVAIEWVSYVFRVLSLAIRLFANLMSGHTLLKILSGFAWSAVSIFGIFLLPLGVILLVTGLEVAIACLQAYIFSVLLCIYINDAFNLH